MKISVNMVAFNAERFIAEAVESVLNQSYTDFEFIIVNDGSTDGTGNVIEKYLGDKRIKYCRFEKNLGISRARNEALSKSKGEYIAVLDADDISLPNRLELQCRFLDHNPGCVAVGANAEVIDAHGNHVYTTDCLCSWKAIRKALPGMPFFHSSVLFRKDTADRIGGYPQALPLADDLLLINMLSDRGELMAIPDVLIKYRITPTSISRRSRRHQKILKKMLGKYLRSSPLTAHEQKRFSSILKPMPAGYRQRNYHLFLAKKYLWVNQRPDATRRHLSMVFRANNFSLEAAALYMMSFLPKRWVRLLYSIKSSSGEAK